ncbi:MAG: OmpA family protein [Deltaproteobacteria bacterium]|nr:OmpA family protein [Deltaproteobacteria bacterium]
MSRRSVWLVVLVSIFAVAFIATGCAKKQVVKEEAAAKPAVTAQKETPRPAAPARIPEAARPEPARPAPARPEAARPPVAEAPRPAPRPATPPPAETIDLTALRIHFAFDDYNLSGKAKENLQRIASWMSKNPNIRVQIEGNTCDIGTAEYNLALGDRRANSAKKYLEGLGIPSNRVTIISYGEERPLVPNKDEADRVQNRRDEFVRK